MQTNFERLKLIFVEMSNDGININGPLKWGFFFFDKDNSKLNRILDELKKNEYVKEDLNRMGDGEWRLYVSKIEVLTPEQLHKRNIAFNELAEKYDVELYDGWDVEKI